MLWISSKLERIRKCGRVPIEADGRVVIKDNSGVAHYAGLATCGSIWACPCCSPKIRNHRALEISTGAANWDRAGNSVYMVTLTAPHDLGMPLKPLLTAISGGFRAIISGRAWVKLRDEISIAGTISSKEVTHGANGWHPHLHVLVFFENDLDALQLYQFSEHVRRQWGRWITKAGYRPPSEKHGVDIQRCESAYEAGLYIAKTQDGKAVGNEIGRGDMKQGRQGNRAPFEILDDFRWTGDKADLRLWNEYETATRGHQAIAWSKHLRKRLEVATEDLSDEEVAASEVGGVDIAVLAPPQWKRVVAVPGLVGYLLDQAEHGGIRAVNAALQAHKISPARAPASPP